MEYRNRANADAGDYLRFLLQFDLEDRDRELLDLFADLYDYDKYHPDTKEYIDYMATKVTLVDLSVDNSTFVEKVLPRIFELGLNRYLNDLNSPTGYFGAIGFRCCIDRNYGDYLISPESLIKFIKSVYTKMRKQFDDSISLNSDLDEICYVLSKTIVLEDRRESALSFYYKDELDSYIKTSSDRYNIQDLITITTGEWNYITRVIDKLYPNLDVGNNCYFIFKILELLNITKDELNEFKYGTINHSLNNHIQRLISKSAVDYTYELRQQVNDLLIEDRPVLDDINKLIGCEVL